MKYGDMVRFRAFPELGMVVKVENRGAKIYLHVHLSNGSKIVAPPSSFTLVPRLEGVKKGDRVNVSH